MSVFHFPSGFVVFLCLVFGRTGISGIIVASFSFKILSSSSLYFSAIEFLSTVGGCWFVLLISISAENRTVFFCRRFSACFFILASAGYAFSHGAIRAMITMRDQQYILVWEQFFVAVLRYFSGSIALFIAGNICVSLYIYSRKRKALI